MTRQSGQPITYGMTIQLLHCASDKFLTVYKREPAAIEKNSMRVALDREGNEGSYFDVEPHWKHSKRGNPVRAPLTFLLLRILYIAGRPRVVHFSRTDICHWQPSTCTASAACQVQKSELDVFLMRLFCSTEMLPDQKECREVNCLNMPTPWRVQLFLHYNETDPNVLKSASAM